MKAGSSNIKVLGILSACALAGGTLAAAIAFGQGAGVYQPSTTTVTATGSTTTVTTTPTVELIIRLNLRGTAGKQTVGNNVTVDVKAKMVEDDKRKQTVSPIFVASYGKLALKSEPGPRGARCEGIPKVKDKSYKLGNDFDTISDGGKTKLTLKISKKARNQVNKQAICKNTKAKARIRVRANDEFGARGKDKRTVKIRPTSK